MAQPSVPSFFMITAAAIVPIVPRAKPRRRRAIGDVAMVAGTDDVGTRPVQAGLPEHRVDLADAGLQARGRTGLAVEGHDIALFPGLPGPDRGHAHFPGEAGISPGPARATPGDSFTEAAARMARWAQEFSMDERVLLEPAFGVL
jgi:hypothetical protein